VIVSEFPEVFTELSEKQFSFWWLSGRCDQRTNIRTGIFDSATGRKDRICPIPNAIAYIHTLVNWNWDHEQEERREG
jgi:hypothetical protein